MDVFIGTILGFAFNYPPAGWAACNGQLIGVNQNQALFALIGTIYGGNGTTTFGLPDLRGKSPIHFGQGAGLSNILIGQTAGTESITLLPANIPAHVHALTGTGVTATATVNVTATAIVGGTVTNETDGGNNSFSSGTTTANVYSEPGGTGTANIAGLAGTAVLAGNTGLTGSSQAFQSRNPYLAINFCIALNGIFPSRN